MERLTNIKIFNKFAILILNSILKLGKMLSSIKIRFLILATNVDKDEIKTTCQNLVLLNKEFF